MSDPQARATALQLLLSANGTSSILINRRSAPGQPGTLRRVGRARTIAAYVTSHNAHTTGFQSSISARADLTDGLRRGDIHAVPIAASASAFADLAQGLRHHQRNTRSPLVLGFVVGLGVGGDRNDPGTEVVTAPGPEGGNEGIVAVALPGDLGAEVAAEDAEGGAGNVAGDPVRHVEQVVEEAASGLEVGVKRILFLRKKPGVWVAEVHPPDGAGGGVFCSRMLAESSLRRCRTGGARPVARPWIGTVGGDAGDPRLLGEAAEGGCGGGTETLT
jgi:hypothetical protein